jgi:hypothetical protein
MSNAETPEPEKQKATSGEQAMSDKAQVARIEGPQL